MTNWVYLPEFSGAALQCHRLSKALQRQGVQVNILTGTHERTLAGSDRIDDIPVHRVLRDISTLRGQIRYFWAIRSFIRQHIHLFDIVHTHGFHPRVNLVVSKLDKPIVQKITAFGLDDPLSVETHPTGKLKARLQKKTRVIVPTSRCLEDRCRQSTIQTRSIMRIPNGVDTTLFHPVAANHKEELRHRLEMPADKIVLIMVGSVTFRKGLDMLIHALYELDEDIKEKTRLWVVGPTINQNSLGQFDQEYFEYSRQLKSMINEMGLQDIVQFKGKQRNIDEYMQAADIFVHPSRNEGQPSSLLEAMASGLPVLVNWLPGITDEIVQAGRYGYLVNCSDISMFTASLRVLINHARLRERLGEQARRHICKHYDIDVIAKRYATLYDRLIDHKQTQSALETLSLKDQLKNG